jgi:hypothetical protein
VEKVFVGVNPIGVEPAPYGNLVILSMQVEFCDHLIHERRGLKADGLGRLPFLRLREVEEVQDHAVQCPRFGADLRGGLASAGA